MRWACIGLIAAAFGLAGIAKLVDPTGLESSLRLVYVAEPLANLITWLLPPIEILLALAVVTSRGKKWAILSVLALLAVFSVMLLRMYTLDHDSSCGCFGRAAERWFGSSIQGALVRTGLLILAGAYCLVSPKSTTV